MEVQERIDDRDEHEERRSIENNLERKDTNTVDWPEDRDESSHYPKNWSSRKKWLTLWLVIAVTLVMNLGSSPISPAAKDIIKEFGHTKSEIQAIVVSIFVLGFAWGPMFWAPLSEVYGRNIIYFICLVFYIIFSCICAVSKNMTMLIIFRFLTGFAASQTAGGTIGDMFDKDRESLAMSFYGLAPIAANALSPVIGGYMAQIYGWRWVFWLNAIMAGPVLIVAFFFLPETNHDTLLQRKAKKIGKNIPKHKEKGLSFGVLTRPFRMLFTSKIVFLCALYLAFLYGVVYVFLVSMGMVFREIYGFNTGEVGLAYIGMAIGMVAGSIGAGITGDNAMAKAEKLKGKAHAERRLVPARYTGLLMPIGLFWYGWSAQQRVHWICPIFATSFLGISLADAFVSIQTYMLDAFPKQSAESLAATTFLRSIFGCILPLASAPLYMKLKFSWGNSLLGFISLLLVPIPWIFLRWGKNIRHNQGIDVDVDLHEHLHELKDRVDPRENGDEEKDGIATSENTTRRNTDNTEAV